ncbi:MAG: hypothetical protein AAF514_10145 [Verrucomicrobiota bacterium]
MFGAFFPLLVRLDQLLHRSGFVSARTAIGIEALGLLISLIGILASLAVGAQLIRAKGWRWLGLFLLSVMLGLGLVGLGFRLGTAILYAT